MQTTHLLAAAFAVLGLVACSSSTTGNGTGTGNGNGNGAGTGSPLLGGGGTGGGTDRSTCNQNCASLGVTADQLASFVGLDCQTAIVTIEGNGNSSGGTSGSSGSSGTDCNGCTWDGSSCIYLTGSGGNYFACANSCCGR